MTHTDLIVAIVRGWSRPIRYLELGCGRHATFNDVIATGATCVGVDIAYPPDSGDRWRTEYADAVEWLTAYKGEPFDVIFIDDLHEYQHVIQEVTLAVRHLTETGVIIMHDTWPPTPAYSRPEDCGTTWQAARWLNGPGRLLLDVESMTLPFLCGLTLVRRRWRPEWMEVAG